MRLQALPLAKSPSSTSALPLLLVSWLVALAIVAAIWNPLYGKASQTSALVDNDDAMRLVQVREWMAGQDWYDLTQKRLNPPDSPVAHWSRIVDVPIALLIRLFGLALPPNAAEGAAITLWPTMLGAATAFALLAFALALFSPAAVVAGSIVLGFNFALFFQFAPGRIDHHGLQMLLALALCIATAHALTTERPRSGIAAGAIAALMLTIGLETVFFVAAATIAFGLVWISSGIRASRTTRMFGLTLAAATLLLFGLTTAPDRWTLPACDAISLPWLWLATAGGATLAALGAIRAPQRPIHRAVSAVAPAVAIGLVFVALWPECLRGPYADVDPLARELWLSGVGEARSTLDLIRSNPGTFLFFLVFPLFGTLGLGLAVAQEEGARPAFALLLAFASIGLVTAFFQMRGAPLAAMFGFFGWLYIIDLALKREGEGTRPFHYGVAGLAFVASLPFVWSALGSVFVGTESQSTDCREPSDFVDLAAQPAGIVLAPVTLGPRILVTTDHAVIAAPYHRNVAGNHIALEALTSEDHTARQIVDEKNIRYVAVCLFGETSRRLAAAGENNFTRMLLAGAAPRWLLPLHKNAPLGVWRVVEDGRAAGSPGINLAAD